MTSPDIAARTAPFLRACLDCMGGNLVGVYLHGSAAMGCFHPARSDLDYLVVLGAQVKGETVSNSLRLRLDEALDYLEENPRTRVVVTGGKGPGGGPPSAARESAPPLGRTAACQSRSNSAAAPIPPPTHIQTMPYRPPVRWSW